MDEQKDTHEEQHNPEEQPAREEPHEHAHEEHEHAHGEEGAPRYYYGNKMARIYLLALEDVLGKNGVNALLNLAKLKHLINNYPPNNFEREFPFEDFAALNQALDDVYGPRGGRGLGTRGGRATFKYVLKEYGAMLGISDLAMRLMPLGMKLRLGLGVMAETFNRSSDQVVRLEEDNEHFYYHIVRCPVCWGRKSQTPICYVALGLLQESLAWVTGGKNMSVVETTCIAKGDPTCCFVIDKKPLD